MIGIRALSAVMAFAVAGGPTVAQEGDLAAFRRLRAEAMTARDAGNLAEAERLLAQAEGHVPNHPGVIVLRARIAAQDGRPGDAIGQLQRYADAGLAADVSRDPALAPLVADGAGAGVAQALLANQGPVGGESVTDVLSLPGSGLVESLVRDAARDRWLVSQVRGRTIVAIADDGTVTPWLAEDAGRGAVVGLAIDPARGLVWAATMALPPATHGRPADAPPFEPALLRIDLTSATVTGRYPVPPGATERGAGDVTLGTDGTVYVANPVGGDLFRLRPGADALDVLLAPGTLGSPQGMVAGTDGSLIVADYSSGLWRVEADGSARRLAAPDDAVLIGVDGLIDAGDALYAIQNGSAPQRVLRLALDADRTRIEAAEMVAANLSQIDEPTTGLIHDGDLVFVARSQWSAFDDEGALRAPDPAPAVIARLRPAQRSAP
jgi:streptogramin lyase